MRMVSVTTAANAAQARILAARLGAAGIVWDLRGGVDGPYPVGPVEVLVEEQGLEEARELLGVEEYDGELDERAPRELWMILIVIVALALFTLARVLGG
jgi:hypothetical protein